LKWLVVIKIKKSAPYTHDLAKLANLAGLKLTKDQLDNLKIINSFNISGRYDDAKLMFYKKCTLSYTKEYLNITKKLLLWLRKKYPQK